MGFAEFVGWTVIFFALFMLIFSAPGLWFLLVATAFLVGIMLLPFVVLGIGLDHHLDLDKEEDDRL